MSLYARQHDCPTCTCTKPLTSLKEAEQEAVRRIDADKPLTSLQALQLSMQQDYNDAIAYAIQTDSPREFLIAWNEGDWQTLRDEWPDFKLPSIAKNITNKS